MVYEWPFEVLVSGKTLQSTQGCYRCSIAYYLTASSIRKGSKTYPQAFRAIRVIRTLPLSAFELMDATTVEGHSARNFRYSASIAHQAVALGAQVPVEFELRPTKPGLRLLGVSCELVEIHGIEHEQATDHENFRSSSRVFRWELLDAPTEKGGDGAVCLKRELPLPDLAAKCSPDVDACGIHVSHALHFDMLAEDAQGEKITVRPHLACNPTRYREDADHVITASRHPSDNLVRLATLAHRWLGPLCQGARVHVVGGLGRSPDTAKVLGA